MGKEKDQDKKEVQDHPMSLSEDSSHSTMRTVHCKAFGDVEIWQPPSEAADSDNAFCILRKTLTSKSSLRYQSSTFGNAAL